MLSNGYQEEIPLGMQVVKAQSPLYSQGQEYFQAGHRTNYYFRAYLHTTECCFVHIISYNDSHNVTLLLSFSFLIAGAG